MSTDLIITKTIFFYKIESSHCIHYSQTTSASLLLVGPSKEVKMK